MKIYELFEQQEQHQDIIVCRAVTGKLATIARTGQPIPMAHRGINWWADGHSVKDIIKEWHLDFYADGEGEEHLGGVIIAHKTYYKIYDNWAIFESGWGLGVEHPINDVIQYLSEFGYDSNEELIEQLSFYGMEKFGQETFIPSFPINDKNQIPILPQGICSVGPINNYKVIKDFNRENL